MKTVEQIYDFQRRSLLAALMMAGVHPFHPACAVLVEPFTFDSITNCYAYLTADEITATNFYRDALTLQPLCEDALAELPGAP